MAEMATFLRVIPMLVVIALMSSCCIGVYGVPIPYGDFGKRIYLMF